MTRVLPGVYVSLNDLSQIPEGAQTLNVGYVLKANRGPVNEWNLVTSPTDFLTKYTFSGKVKKTDDPTFHSILKVMAQTNAMYVVRAANNPLYGGAVIKKAKDYGTVLKVDKDTETITIIGDELPAVGELVELKGSNVVDGYYVVKEAKDGSITIAKDVTITGDITSNYINTDLYYYDKSNLTEFHGESEPTLVVSSEGIASGFASKEYLELNSNVGDYKTFDLFLGEYDITTLSPDGADRQWLFSQGANQGTKGFGISIENNGHSRSFVGSKDGNWDIASAHPGSKTYAVGQKVKFWLNFNGETYTLYSSVNGGAWSEDWHIDSTKKMFFPKTNRMGGDGSVNYFRGSIDLNYFSLVFNKISDENKVRLVKSPVVPLNAIKIADISSVVAADNKFLLSGNVKTKFTIGDIFTVKGSTNGVLDGNYTVVSTAEYNEETSKTEVEVKETVAEGSGGAVYYNSLVNPEGFANSFSDEDLMLITGINPGAYNGDIAFTIISALDNKEDLVYFKGAKGLFDEPCTFDTMQLGVINTETNEQVESFTFSRDPEAKAIDGSLLFVEDVVAGSAYIKVINNPATTDVPNSTLAGTPVSATGGSDGEAVTAADLASALTVFEDKTIPISIIGNGCSVEAESALYQQTLVQLAVTRKDCMVFLNSRKSDEKVTLPSTRAANIVNYKKNILGSTSFYGCMYAPHVLTADIFNSRDVEIGADSVAIAGWLEVLNNLRYPYAYAGPRNGLVSGVVCNWKIGDMSGEAQSLNDASINYVAYDGKVGRYYMQCQNTLQVANSAMRNIGTVLNVLDIKETLATNLKEYLQLPITDELRRDIVTTANDYLGPMAGVRFYNYAFQDITTMADVADNTLRFLLTLSPSMYAQKIYLTINIVRASFDFSILQSA